MQYGRLAAVIPHPQDPHPAPLLEGVPSTVYTYCIPPNDSFSVLLYQELPTSSQC